MSIRSENESDSLWLLLDTVCNAFGGMLLVALLFAIFANVEQKNTVPAALTNQIAKVSNDLVIAQAAYTNLLPKVLPLESRTQVWNQVRILDTNTTALALTVSNLTEDVSNRWWMVAHPDAVASNANLEYRILMDDLATASNSLAVIMKTFAELTNEWHSLALEAEAKAAKVPQLHLPKEHPAEKQAYNILLKYDQVYFVREHAGGKPSANTSGLSWVLGNGDQIVLAPIKGKGVAPDGEPAAQQLAALDLAKAYLVCWVYADSFGTFSKLKETIKSTSTNLEYGWVPLTMDQSVSVAADPVAPTPAQ